MAKYAVLEEQSVDLNIVNDDRLTVTLTLTLILTLNPIPNPNPNPIPNPNPEPNPNPNPNIVNDDRLTVGLRVTLPLTPCPASRLYLAYSSPISPQVLTASFPVIRMRAETLQVG